MNPHRVEILQGPDTRGRYYYAAFWMDVDNGALVERSQRSFGELPPVALANVTDRRGGFAPSEARDCHAQCERIRATQRVRRATDELLKSVTG